jgi:hypothetical protein
LWIRIRSIPGLFGKVGSGSNLSSRISVFILLNFLENGQFIIDNISVPDPDANPDPPEPHVRIHMISYCFVTSLKNDVYVPTERNKQINLSKNLLFVGVLKVTDKNRRIRIPIWIRIH